MVVSRALSEKLIVGKFIGNISLSNARRGIIRNLNHVEKEIKRAQTAEAKKKLEKTRKALEGINKYLERFENAQDQLTKKDIQFVGRMEEDMQEVLNLLHQMASEGFPVALLEAEKKSIGRLGKNFKVKLRVHAALFNDLANKAEAIERQSA